MKKSDMLPGLAAAQWVRFLAPLSKVVMVLSLIDLAVYVVTGATAETVPPWMYALFAVTITIFFVVILLMFAGLEKGHREANAGYTTTGGKYPEVPQLDSRTGKVVREIGQALTTEQPARSKRLK